MAGTRRVGPPARVRRLVVSSSGAAYGYHADNPVPLTLTIDEIAARLGKRTLLLPESL